MYHGRIMGASWACRIQPAPEGTLMSESWTPYPAEPDLEGARAACERLYCETLFPEASTSAAAALDEEAAQVHGEIARLCVVLQGTRMVDALQTCIKRYLTFPRCTVHAWLASNTTRVPAAAAPADERKCEC
jgi:hypothetical protein